MATKKRTLKVFLCYARDDVVAVRNLYNHLIRDGVDVWFDKAKLVPGQDWELEIRKALRESDVIVFCHTRVFNQTGFRQKEVKLAKEQADLHPSGKIVLIPARLEECGVLEELQRWQWVDLFEKDGYESLLRALRLRAREIGVTLDIKKSRQAKTTPSKSKTKKLLPKFNLGNYLYKYNSLEYLRAEVELPWLGQVFIAPREFEQITSSRSIIVMGDEGSGKTALELQIKAFAEKRDSNLLVASWRPQPLSEMSDDDIAESILFQLMHSLSFALLQTIIRAPSMFFAAPNWARDFIVWFIPQFLRGDREFYFNLLTDQNNPSVLQTVTNIFSVRKELFQSYTPPLSVLSHFVDAVKQMGYEKIWVFVVGLDTLSSLEQDRMKQYLPKFLSTLKYIDDPMFVFKMIVSHELGSRFWAVDKKLHRHFGIHLLNWGVEELARIVEMRARLILERDKIVLDDLCRDKTWFQWLKRYAGNTPRGWLDLTRPILEAYLRKGESLSKTEWLDAYRVSPPLLHLDLETDRVFIGYGEINIMGMGYKLLRYLYEHPNHFCTKTELYYRVFKGLPKVPHDKKDEGWDDFAKWEGVVDTTLWRLRQAVEWDVRGASSLYLVSERDRGIIRLENTI